MARRYWITDQIDVLNAIEHEPATVKVMDERIFPDHPNRDRRDPSRDAAIRRNARREITAGHVSVDDGVYSLTPAGIAYLKELSR